MDGAVGDYIRGKIAKANLVPFTSVWDNGFRQITSSTGPIKEPGDLAGFKIRVPLAAMGVHVLRLWRGAGIDPAGRGLFGAAGPDRRRPGKPAGLHLHYEFFEAQKSCSLTNHAWTGFWLLESGKVWKNVPQDLQKAMAKHFDAVALKPRDDIVKANQSLQADLEAKGFVFNMTSGEVFQQARARTSFYKDARAKFGDEAWNLLQKFAGPIG